MRKIMVQRERRGIREALVGRGFDRGPLQRPNPILWVKNWLAISKKEEKERQILAYFVGKRSFKALEGSMLKAYYKLGMVTFKVLKDLDINDESDISQSASQKGGLDGPYEDYGG